MSGEVVKTKIPLSIEEETYIVALLGRGDTRNQIVEQVKAKFGRQLSDGTLVAVRKRNKENLEIIKQRWLEKNEADAEAIKHKANKILSKRLDRDEKVNAVVEKARQDYLDKVIEFKEYLEIVRSHKENTISEIVSVSREMHNQVKETPEDRSSGGSNTDALIEAIKNSDTVALNQLIFKGGGGNDSSVDGSVKV